MNFGDIKNIHFVGIGGEAHDDARRFPSAAAFSAAGSPRISSQYPSAATVPSAATDMSMRTFMISPES